jgi:CDP-glucose 4,6-dehydratase
MENPLGRQLRELPGPLLLTGHTGFKGTWMTFLLEHLNVPVVGYSLPPEKDSLFHRADRTGSISEVFADIRDYETFEKFIDEKKPSAIIHMAAQPLVLKSYENPRETFDVNVMGTVNVLDIAFKKDFVKTIVVVTTDKVYRNHDERHEFIETDPLGGKDPYSASKVGAEAVVKAWQQIQIVSGGPNVVSVRAGNVVGGGDFAADRIIPDLIRGVLSGGPVEIRNPNSTRPWQHVLDPLVGYLLATEKLLSGQTIESLNFGPRRLDISVGQVAKIGSRIIPSVSHFTKMTKSTEIAREVAYLQLSSNLSTQLLNWEPKWDSRESIEITFEWWKKSLDKEADPEHLCLSDIILYFSKGPF